MSLKPSQSVGGVPVSSLPARWWQWRYLFARKADPVNDTTGKLCAQHQSGPVWFLADAPSPERLVRRCTLPAASPIFLPILTNASWTPPGMVQSCSDVKKSATFPAKEFTVEVRLDGEIVSGPGAVVIQPKECFDLLGAVPRSQNPPNYSPSATGGYWLMLAPLGEGAHRLEIRAIYKTSGSTVLDLSYDLTAQ